MSIRSLMVHNVTVYNKAGHTSEGRQTWGSGTTSRGRFIPKTMQRLLPSGKFVRVEAICILPATTTIDIDDRIDYNSKKYQVFRLIEPPGSDGQTHHKKVELIQWRLS